MGERHHREGQRAMSWQKWRITRGPAGGGAQYCAAATLARKVIDYCRDNRHRVLRAGER